MMAQAQKSPGRGTPAPKPKPPFLLHKQLRLEEIAALDRSVEEFRGPDSVPRANSTRRVYAADWRSFTGFCQLIGRESLAAEPQTVMRYLAYEADHGRAVSTITRRLVVINHEHKLAGHPSPCDANVGQVLTGIRRKLGTASKPKTPVFPDNLKLMLEETDRSVRGIRDTALMLFLFASGMRRAEAAALDVRDVTSEPQGLRILIRESKTDQEKKGQEVGVQRGLNEQTCPALALERWVRERGTWPGPLFCRIELHTGKITRERLSPAAIADVVKAAAKRAGMPAREFAGHSMRSGCASSASANGADSLAIMRRLRHASLKTTARYIRHGNLFAVDPLKGVL